MKLVWDENGKRFYETGVSNGVLYPQSSLGLYPLGIAWNGLTAVTESPSGAEATPLYADNIKYLNLISAEEFGATIEAFTYPDEFGECDGSGALATGVKVGQQKRKAFGLCYKTLLGNDIDAADYGYKLHLIYGAMAAPSEKAFATVNDAPEAITFSWEVTTTPAPVTGFKPAASIEIDSTKVDPTTLATFEDILYGTAGTAPRMPLPDEVKAMFDVPAPDAIALSTIVPADGAVAIAVNANVVITFNNKIDQEDIVVTDELGGIVAGAKTWDTAGKILTFNPTADLTALTLYLVTVGGVVDIYGQALAPVVKDFHTA